MMKALVHIRIYTTLRIFLLVFFPILLLLSERLLAADLPDTVYIELAEAKVRKEPKHWAAGVLTLSYGSPLEVLERKEGWLKVRATSRVEGFVHESAVTVRKVVLDRSNGAVQINADESDVVLAGKGFNDDIEINYKSSNQELPYHLVDKLAAREIPEEKIASFVATGKLKD